jgi:CRISPR-associated endonuclease Cas3-HD
MPCYWETTVLPTATSIEQEAISFMAEYYAHTAEDKDGRRLPKSDWQLLKDHLRQVAELANAFASPLSLESEATFAGLLHDLGKYAGRFQARLDDNSIHGINHWSVGSLVASEHRALEAAFAIEGHHTGMPALLENDDEPGEGTGLESLKQRLLKLRDPKQALEVNGFAEAVPQLLDLFHAEKFPFPERTSPSMAKQDYSSTHPNDLQLLGGR